MDSLHRCKLPTRSVVAVSGADARSFLQGQLSCDLLGIERRPGQLAAACSPQGRVLEILRLAWHQESVWMLLPRELAAALASRLQRYQMRARIAVSIEPVEAWGVLGSRDGLSAQLAGLAEFPVAPGRTVFAGATASLEAALGGLSVESEGDWNRAAVRAGEPEVWAQTSGRWVPQMLNLDLLDAISFSKGCYTGQEIVARTQNIGRIKRRTWLYAGPADGVPAPGEALFSAGQPAAEVVQAVGRGRRLELLAVVNLADLGQALAIDAEGPASLEPVALPYPVPRDG